MKRLQASCLKYNICQQRASNKGEQTRKVGLLERVKFVSITWFIKGIDNNRYRQDSIINLSYENKSWGMIIDEISDRLQQRGISAHEMNDESKNGPLPRKKQNTHPNKFWCATQAIKHI